MAQFLKRFKFHSKVWFLKNIQPMRRLEYIKPVLRFWPGPSSPACALKITSCTTNPQKQSGQKKKAFTLGQNLPQFFHGETKDFGELFGESTFANLINRQQPQL